MSEQAFRIAVKQSKITHADIKAAKKAANA